MNLTFTTAWVIVEEDAYYSIVDGIIYPTKEEATHQMSLIVRIAFTGMKVIRLSEHIEAVYELGQSGPGFM